MRSNNFTLICTPEEFLARDPVERLLTTRRQIDLERKHWDQTCWVYVDDDDDDAYERELEKPEKVRNICGSAFCLAGWGVTLAGDRFIDEDEVYVPGTGVISVENRANELFGLGRDHELFDGDNSLEDIDRMILELTGRTA